MVENDVSHLLSLSPSQEEEGGPRVTCQESRVTCPVSAAECGHGTLAALAARPQPQRHASLHASQPNIIWLDRIKQFY